MNYWVEPQVDVLGSYRLDIFVKRVVTAKPRQDIVPVVAGDRCGRCLVDRQVACAVSPKAKEKAAFEVGRRKPRLGKSDGSEEKRHR